MTDRRRPFRPSAEGVEPRLLLSAAHHPAPYTGTIHGFLEATSMRGSGVVYEIARASGSITPLGNVGVVYGQVVDTYTRGNFDFAARSITFGLKARGKVAVDVDLSDPFILSATPLRSGNYPATIDRHGQALTLSTRVATLSLPKGPPSHPGALVPFTITFRVGGIA